MQAKTAYSLMRRTMTLFFASKIVSVTKLFYGFCKGDKKQLVQR